MVPPRSHVVPLEGLDRLVDDEGSNPEFMNLTKNQDHMKKHISSELDPEQGEGITNKLKFAVRQLNDRIQLCISGVSNEFSALPTNPEHDQTLVNQSDEFLAPLRQQNHFNNLVNCHTPYPKDNLKEEYEIIECKYMKCHKIKLFVHLHTHQYCHIFKDYLLEWFRCLACRGNAISLQVVQALRLTYYM